MSDQNCRIARTWIHAGTGRREAVLPADDRRPVLLQDTPINTIRRGKETAAVATLAVSGETATGHRAGTAVKSRPSPPRGTVLFASDVVALSSISVLHSDECGNPCPNRGAMATPPRIFREA